MRLVIKNCYNQISALDLDFLYEFVNLKIIDRNFRRVLFCHQRP